MRIVSARYKAKPPRVLSEVFARAREKSAKRRSFWKAYALKHPKKEDA